jgi:hypothetical protein
MRDEQIYSTVLFNKPDLKLEEEGSLYLQSNSVRFLVDE